MKSAETTKSDSPADLTFPSSSDSEFSTTAIPGDALAPPEASEDGTRSASLKQSVQRQFVKRQPTEFQRPDDEAPDQVDEDRNDREDRNLLATLLFGGVPLVFDLFVKLLRGEFGSHLLAGISVVTTVLLGEYLAGAIVVLMPAVRANHS